MTLSTQTMSNSNTAHAQELTVGIQSSMGSGCTTASVTRSAILCVPLRATTTFFCSLESNSSLVKADHIGHALREQLISA